MMWYQYGRRPTMAQWLASSLVPDICARQSNRNRSSTQSSGAFMASRRDSLRPVQRQSDDGVSRRSPSPRFLILAAAILSVACADLESPHSPPSSDGGEFLWNGGESGYGTPSFAGGHL